MLFSVSFLITMTFCFCIFVCLFFYRKVVCPCLSPVCFVCWCQDVKGYKRNVKKKAKKKNLKDGDIFRS